MSRDENSILTDGDSAQDKYTLMVPNGLAFSEFGDTKTGRLSRLDVLITVESPARASVDRFGLAQN
jgi:hypothetical protein